MNFKLSAIVFALTLAILAPLSPALAAHSQLDGKTFKGEVKFGKEPDPDSFVFDKGTFRSTACDEYGFTSAPYSSKEAGKDSVAFTSKTENKDGWSIVWNGTIKGDHITGSAVRTDSGGKVEKGAFEGKLTK